MKEIEVGDLVVWRHFLHRDSPVEASVVVAVTDITQATHPDPDTYITIFRQGVLYSIGRKFIVAVTPFPYQPASQRRS